MSFNRSIFRLCCVVESSNAWVDACREEKRGMAGQRDVPVKNMSEMMNKM